KKGDFVAALEYQYLFFKKSGTGQYDLACYYARVGDVSGALYYLQIAAKDDFSDADWARRDADLVNVRRDPRWPAVFAYMRAYQPHWATCGISETSLMLPADSTPSQPLPLFIALHGLYRTPHDS